LGKPRGFGKARKRRRDGGAEKEFGVGERSGERLAMCARNSTPWESEKVEWWCEEARVRAVV